MKQCPVCKTTYTDDSLKYCLADGASLYFLSDEQETVQVSFRDAAPRENIAAPPVIIQPAGTQPVSPARSGVSPLLVVILVILLLLVTAAFAAFLLYWSAAGQQQTTVVASPTATPVETPKPKETPLNPELQIPEQTPRLPEMPTFSTPETIGTAARVNSPGDGFLALRTEPNTETGQRIIKIPHGAVITVGGCLGRTRLGSRIGRWCRANYGAHSGWVFDAWLVY